MTAKVIPLFRVPRPVGAQPCGSGTVPGGVSAPCGRRDTRLYAEGWRCPGHDPQTAHLRLPAPAQGAA
ncbi:hypothetical protein [Actinoplanes rectilineatus]|uniref:hypothetical protein n=1 Tax=Actinoplanes rectilineatus TaxID=113571 RepID=UPI0005F28161|nr:hypothetical protein [Actinoplanes rectilineatus]